MASYERNFPLKDLAPVFAEIEAARKATEEARAAAKKEKGKNHVAAEEPLREPGALQLEEAMAGRRTADAVVQ